MKSSLAHDLYDLHPHYAGLFRSKTELDFDHDLYYWMQLVLVCGDMQLIPCINAVYLELQNPA
jgi:hypothetical protein